MPPTSAATRLDRLPTAVPDKTLRHNRDICRGWLGWLEAHGRSRLTTYQYGAKLDELLEFLGSSPLDDVTLPQLEAWVARPRKGRGGGRLGADATRAKDVLVVRGLWKWAIAHSKLAHDPTINLELPRVKNEDPRAIDIDTWHQFWISPTLTDVERVAFGLGFFCGLRREEMCRLSPHNYDVKLGRLVDFKRKGDRGRNSGSVPVVSLARLFAQEHPRLLADASAFLGPLEALCVDRTDGRWLLPWGEQAGAQGLRGGVRPVPDGMTSPDQVNHHLRYALKRAGMPERVFTPHALRHSFVTYLLRSGVALQVVSKLANHSSIDITMRYVRVADDPIAAMLESTHLKGSRW